MCELEVFELGAAEASTKEGTVCLALLWEKRALRFIEAILVEVVGGPQRTLKECVTRAYAASLRKYHNFLVRGTFSIAVNAAPTRAKFIAKLDPASTSETTIIDKAAKILPALSRLLDTIDMFLERISLEKSP